MAQETRRCPQQSSCRSGSSGTCGTADWSRSSRRVRSKRRNPAPAPVRPVCAYPGRECVEEGAFTSGGIENLAGEVTAEVGDDRRCQSAGVKTLSVVASLGSGTSRRALLGRRSDRDARNSELGSQRGAAPAEFGFQGEDGLRADGQSLCHGVLRQSFAFPQPGKIPPRKGAPNSASPAPDHIDRATHGVERGNRPLTSQHVACGSPREPRASSQRGN